MKDLQEMNLVDDFLVNSLTSHKIYGESASRYILECIFRRKIGKLTVVPQRNVAVIFITTYDPFDRDRMVYTIRNCCVEEPDLPYEDGAETLFLYTRGTKGDPPRELRELLQYMENSTEENARSEGLKALHRMVTEVKRDGEVGFAYMKSFEREQRVREEGRLEGLNEGLSEGLSEGRREGLSEGKAEALLTVLGCKGEVPETLRSKILAEKNPVLLNEWFLRALSCESIEEFTRAELRCGAVEG